MQVMYIPTYYASSFGSCLLNRDGDDSPRFHTGILGLRYSFFGTFRFPPKEKLQFCLLPIRTCAPLPPPPPLCPKSTTQNYLGHPAVSSLHQQQQQHWQRQRDRFLASHVWISIPVAISPFLARSRPLLHLISYFQGMAHCLWRSSGSFFMSISSIFLRHHMCTYKVMRTSGRCFELNPTGRI